MSDAKGHDDAAGAVSNGGGGNHGHGGGGRSHGHGHGGGGGHEEHEGAPEWLISFADNVMLQMGFFVILLAMAMKNPTGSAAGAGSPGTDPNGTPLPSADQLDFALAVREAFNNPVTLDSTNPKDYLLVQRLRVRMGGGSDALEDGLRGRDHDVQSVRPSETFGAGGALSFDRGSTEFSDETQGAIEKLAARFRGYQTILEIRGHVSAAEAFDQDDRGMGLAYARAAAVARALAERGIEWNRLRIVSCGDSERVQALAYDDEQHAVNQRVEIVERNQAARPPP